MSAGQAAKNILLGFPNSKALLGGASAWKAAGFGLADAALSP